MTWASLRLRCLSEDRPSVFRSVEIEKMPILGIFGRIAEERVVIGQECINC